MSYRLLQAQFMAPDLKLDNAYGLMNIINQSTGNSLSTGNMDKLVVLIKSIVLFNAVPCGRSGGGSR